MSSTSTRPRRSGRPTAAEAQQLDHEIREAALDLFLANGYEGTSMDDVAASARTTKQSVYARFTSKEELFVATLRWAVERKDWPYKEPPLPPTDDLEAALRAVATTAVRRALNPDMIGLLRLAAAHAARFPEVARHANAQHFPRQRFVADLLREHAATGEIQAEDPDTLAEHFLGLVSAVPAQLAQVGVIRSRPAQKALTDSAIKLFLRSLRPD